MRMELSYFGVALSQNREHYLKAHGVGFTLREIREVARFRPVEPDIRIDRIARSL